MSDKRMSMDEIVSVFPNSWVLIIEPEYHLGTADVKSGIVKLSSESHEEFLKESAGVKVNSAVEFTGDLASLEQNAIITSYWSKLKK